MSNCSTETWTLNDIKEALEKENFKNKRIVIPMFQRGKRWNEKKKAGFIDSLRKGYPVGTLLFYKTYDGVQEIYTLIDGLQRATAIREYLSNPSKFFEISDFRQETLEKIHNLIVVGGNKESQKKKINDIIVSHINHLTNFDDLEMLDIFTKLSAEFPTLDSKLVEFADALREDIKLVKANYSSIRDMTIPAVVYSGEEETLPEIFERINSQGVPLTEYEIYAASWPRKEFTITNEKIVNYVLKKYDHLSDDDYTIKGYDRDEKRRNKSVNAFEYVFGLSKHIQNEYPSLRFYHKLKDDETNPVAFQLLNACFNSAHSQIKEVYRIINRYCDSIKKIEKLEEALFSSIEFVNKCIEPILKFKGNNKKEQSKIYHSQYQIMSLISFVFRTKYDINDNNLKVLDSWRESKEKLENNIWQYYVYDIVLKYWGEGGTGKIHTANSEKRYLTELTKGQFAAAFDTYVEERYGRNQKSKIPNPVDVDYVILNTVYLKHFTAMDQLSIDKFDVEHIATKKQMVDLMHKATQDEKGLPIAHIANLCYLPEYENRSKGDKNFYQDDGYLAKSTYTLEEIEQKFSFTKKKDLEFMNIEYKKGDFEILKDFYIEFLRNRSKILKDKFLNSLGFEN